MRILVTGAAGFIGSRLCEVLSERGDEVLGIDNINDYYDIRLKLARLRRIGIQEKDIGSVPVKSFKHASLSFLRADITDAPAMRSIFSEWHPEALMNLAAQAGVRYSIENPYTYIKNNIDGFLNLLECARHFPVERFVYASSSSVYGDNMSVPFSEGDRVDDPRSLYAATKISNEVMARAYRNLYGVPAVGLRFFTVYGPWGRPDMAPMLFASAITEGRPIKVFNKGDMMRDFTYIDDIVKGIVKVIDGRKMPDCESDIYNIGHGSPMPLMDFIEILEKHIGQKAQRQYMPMQKGDVKVTFCDTERLEKDYGYRAETSLEEGIAEFASWYKSPLNPLR